jgi:hypothetical protein
VTANLPPSSAAVRSIFAVPAETELSRSVSTAASEAGNRSPAAEISAAAGPISRACSRTMASTSSRTYSGLPAACAVSCRSVSPGGDPIIAVTRAVTSVSVSGPSVTTAPPWRMAAARSSCTSGRRGVGRHVPISSSRSWPMEAAS